MEHQDWGGKLALVSKDGFRETLEILWPGFLIMEIVV